MNESTKYIDRYRPRAQSLFEQHRSRTNTELTINLLERLISPPIPSNETTVSDDQCQRVNQQSARRTLFFISQPLIAGFLIFPLLILFWQAGWNFMDRWLNTSIAEHWSVLVLLYILAQCILLCIYLNQDHLYDYLHKQKFSLWIVIVLQSHTFITASTYILQWVSMWTIWDRYTSQDWILMLIVSIAALLAVIVLMGHPCDLVCAPFILSYDSIEYNVRIGSPFVVEKVIIYFRKNQIFYFNVFQMNEYLAHGLNYIVYEYIIALLSILAWRGSYKLLDVCLYPKNDYMSAGLSLSLGYPLYFFLMYTQSYSNKIRLLPSFVFLNCPSFNQNFRHLTAFFACILLWRGYWLLFDTYIATLALTSKSPYLFYLICMVISFTILSLFRSASSINGPMSHMHDEYDLFPHYPNCYLVELLKNEGKPSDKISSDSSRTTSLEPYTVTFLE